ncbi:hypothetical protein GCM10020258_30650 [Sphingomonas yabuuchiae]
MPVKADEPAYRMGLSTNEEPDTLWVRYTYGSLVTPTTTYEINARTGERRTLKVTPVPGYDPSLYVTERVWAPARDGTRIPVSIVYRKGVKRDGTAPLFQYAYGSYGISTDPGSMRGGSGCSIGAWSMPSRISAAGRKWGAAGMMTAICSTRRTASPTLST